MNPDSLNAILEPLTDSEKRQLGRLIGVELREKDADAEDYSEVESTYTNGWDDGFYVGRLFGRQSRRWRFLEGVGTGIALTVLLFMIAGIV